MSLLNVKLVRARRRDGLGNAQLTAGTFCRAIVRRALRGFTYRRIMSEKEIAISDNRHERLSQTDIGNDALTRLDLLERVVTHKKLFFASAWASYDTARPGEFHLLPATHRIADLRSDYKEMKAMIFGAYPEWDEIVEGLTALERRINDISAS